MIFGKRIAGAAALGVAMLGSSLFVPPARAAYIVTLQQVGANVVATGSGTINTTDLGLLFSSTFAGPGIAPDVATIITGPPGGASAAEYTGFTGPTSFGSGGLAGESSGSGDMVGIGAGNLLFVPAGYAPGNPLSDTATYDNRTFSSLGVTPGTYVWTWGSGATADTFTLQIGAASVPEPASLALLGTGVLGLGMVRRRRAAR